MLAVQTVHTSGINLASLVSIIAGFAAVATVMLSMIYRRIDKRDKAHETEIANLRKDFTDGLTNLGNLLSARLETKDAVSEIKERLSKLEGSLTPHP